MTHGPRKSAGIALAIAVLGAGCRGGAEPASVSAARTLVTIGAGRPSLLVVEREGDGLGAVAVAVSTEGIAADRGAAPAAALAALVEERVRAKGISRVGSAVGWNGWRLKALVDTPVEAAAVIGAIREAMLTPIAPNEPALANVARKMDALAHRPLADRALLDAVRCTGEAFGLGDDTPPGPAELEGWRLQACGLGRVAIATAGQPSFANAVATGLARAPAWPHAAPIIPDPWPSPDSRAVVYDASGQLSPGSARVIVMVRTSTPERAVAAAPRLGDLDGPLASRLAGLDAPARIQSVVATAHVDGGCVAVTLDIAARDLASDAPARVATAAALARQEMSVEIADSAAPRELRQSLATRAPDPRDAAEDSAWWGLSGRHSGEDASRSSLVVGVAATRDSPDRVTPAPPGSPSQRGMSGVSEAIRTEVDRATVAWHAPVVESRVRVERGQGDVWIMLASPCGTVSEANADAGAGAVVATAAALQAAPSSNDERLEPYVAADGIGIVAHGPARPGESPEAHARRLADVVGRAFAADALERGFVTQARTLLLARAAELDARAMGALGGALAPGHPAWFEPFGTSFGLGSTSDERVAIRVASMRSGPLRVAVLANSDQAQGESAVRAVDRWVTRQPSEARSCPLPPALAPPRPGTYAVELLPGTLSEAILAFPLTVADEPARITASWMAAALGDREGLLARALGNPAQGDIPTTPLAQEWSAELIGGASTPALVIRLVSPDATLDAAVAQTRALLDRLQKGGLRDTDRTRAETAMARQATGASLDPRERVIGLWRSDPAISGAAPRAPALDAMRAFAAAQLRDDALVIVAARPARVEPDRLPSSRLPKTPTQ